MRKLFLCVLLLVAVAQAKAQTEVGRVSFVPQVGLNLTNINFWDGKVGFAAGVGVDYQLTNKLALSSGLTYSYLNYGMLDKTYSMGRVGIPVTLDLYLIDGLAVKAGVQADFKTNENDVATMNGFTFSIPVGLSYEFSRVVVDARYNIGVNTEETKDFVVNYKHEYNGWFQLTVGYRF